MATENIYGYKGDLIIPDPIKKLSSDNSNSQTNTETNTNTQTGNMFGYSGDLKLPEQFTDSYTPSDLEKFRYGVALETNTIGDIGRFVETAWESIGQKTWEEARQDVEKERLDNVYKDFMWAKGGKYDNDLATWGGRSATLMLDPIYMVMPWGLALRGATLAPKMAKLAAMGAGVGGVDMALRSKMRTGEVDLSSVSLGAGIGAAAGPLGYGVQKVGGKLINKAFPNLFKSADEAKTVESILRKNYETKYDLNASQLQKVSEVSELPSIARVFKSVVNAENTAAKYFMPKDKIVNQLKNFIGKDIKKIKQKSFKFDGKVYKVEKTSKTAINQLIDELENAAAKGGEQFNKKVFTARSNHLVTVLRELEKRESVTEKVIRGLLSVSARPIAFGGAGAVYGTLFTETDEGFRNAVIAGAVVGLVSKRLSSGSIKGISVARQKEIGGILKQSYFKQFLRYASISTAHSQQSKLTARGPILDEFSNILFNRPTDVVNRTVWGSIADDQSRLIGATSSVEGMTERAMSGFIGGIREALGTTNSNLLDSAKLKLFQNQYLKVKRNLTPEEINVLQIQDEALDIIRGSTTTGKSAESVTMANGVRKWLNDFKKYYNDVGFTEKELLDNYFPRKFNYELIRDPRTGKISNEFRKDIEDIYATLLANPKSKLTKLQRTKSAKQLADDYIDGINRPEQIDIINLKQTDKIVKSEGELPLSRHINEQRELQGSWDEVESKLKKYLINDIRMVLTDITSNTVKSVEFARRFGTKAEGINGYLRQIFKQYQGNGFDELEYDGFFNNQHRTDVEAITDAVNSYFGKYGRKPKTWEKNIVGTLSTLANFSMMDKVTIANLGDLIQPFQNSRHFASAFLGMRTNVSNMMELIQTKATKALLKDSFVTKDGGSSPLLINGEAGSYLNLVGKSNEYFFKAIGLEGITNMARRYAYNVGAVDAHNTAKLFLRELIKEVGPMRTNFENLRQAGLNVSKIKNKKLLEEINYLIKNGTAQVTDGRITNLDEIIKFARMNKLDDAVKSADTAALVDRVGMFAANRDAIIPTVGNRLLFSQSRNPWLRVLGQFSSWAMAKTTQTNAMLRRIEDGNAKQLVTMLGALSIYGGIKEIRDWAKHGEWNAYREFRDDKPQWFAKTAELSGQVLPWMSTLAVNRLWGYQKYRPTELAPIDSILKDWFEFGSSAISATFGAGDWDTAIRNMYEVLPAPTVRGILQRLGVPLVDYMKDPNFTIDFDNELDEPDNLTKKFFFPKLNKGGAIDKTRIKFNKGDVVNKSFTDAYSEARGNKQELFEWQGNQYTTKRADETAEEYKKFLGVNTFAKNNYLLKEEINDANDRSALNAVVKEHEKIYPKKKPILEKKENIIIPKQKPVIKKDNKSKFNLFSSAEAAIPDNKQEIEVNAEKFLEKDIQPKDAVETNKFGWNTLVNKIPPNIRLMVNDVFTQSTGGKFDKIFTEKNLNPEYQSILKSVALDVLSKGKTNIEYEDYQSVEGDNAYADVSYTAKGFPDLTNKRFNLKTSLGQATIKIDDQGNLIIIDRFNFNDSEDVNSFTDFYQMVKEIGGSVLQGEFYNAKRKVGKWFGSPNGEGQNVRINLGKVDLAKFKDVKIDRITLAKGDTPSRAWMRDYYFDGKGGYDTFMSFEEFATGPGIQLYLNSRKKSKGGVIRKEMRFGGGMDSRYGGGSSNRGGSRSSSNQGRSRHSRSSNTGSSFAAARAAMTSNKAYTGGSTARENYISNQYNKTKTSNTGGDNGGSGSNNNNNNNNTVKNTSTSTKNKKQNNALEKVFDVLGSGDTSILGKTKKSTDIYNDDSWEGLDLDSGSVKSAKPETYVGPMFGYEIDNPISIDAITNKNIGARVVGGAAVIGPTYKGSAYLKGATDVQNFGDIDKSFNVDFSNQSGIEVKGSYDLNNSMLSGNVSKYTNIGNTGYSVGVGVDYNDGNIGPSFQIRKDFKRGGLLDKKRG